MSAKSLQRFNSVGAIALLGASLTMAGNVLAADAGKGVLDSLFGLKPVGQSAEMLGGEDKDVAHLGGYGAALSSGNIYCTTLLGSTTSSSPVTVPTYTAPISSASGTCNRIESVGVASYKCPNSYVHFYLEGGEYKYYTSQQAVNSYSVGQSVTNSFRNPTGIVASPLARRFSSPRYVSTSQSYAKFMGLASVPEDMVTTDAAMLDLETALKYNFGGLIAFGSSNGNLAIEAEGAFRKFDVEEVVGAGVALPDPSGDVSIFTLMANATFQLGQSSGFQPYIGVGAGAGYIKMDKLEGLAGIPHIDTEAYGLALQGILGGQFNLGDGLSLVAEARYLRLNDLQFTDEFGSDHNFDLDAPELAVGVKFGF